MMGPPGAGKGTQGERLAAHYGVPRYSTGDILREARSGGTELGRRAQGYMDAGELVPDEVILGVVDEVLRTDEAARGFVFDGFPRTVAQAEGLASILRAQGVALDAVIDLDVPRGVLDERLSGRRGEDARSDDRPETVARRLEVYAEETAPVLEWYERSDVPLLRIDGDRDIETIQQDLRRRLST
ncbi:MAG: adenylate kinase [Gemmatimonadota bacterium]